MMHAIYLHPMPLLLGVAILCVQTRNVLEALERHHYERRRARGGK